jgi:PAS domain S-box-containing protein
VNDTVFGPPHAVITIDDGGDIVDVDSGAEEVFGLRRSEAVGRPVAELIIPRRQESEHWIRVRRIPSAEPARRFARRTELPARRGEESQARAELSQARVELTVTRADEGAARFGASIGDPSDRRGADFQSAPQALLERAEEVAQIGSWDWDLETGRLLWSDNLFRLYGLEPGEITPTPGYVLEQVHPDDQERVEREVESARRGGQLRPLEYRFVRPDAAVRRLCATQAVVEQGEGRPRRLVGTVQDITDRRRAERQIAAHVAVSEALAEWQTLEQGAARLLRKLAEKLDCAAGVLWLPDRDVIVARVIWQSGSSDVAELESVIRQLRLPRGVGLAGRVLESGKPMNVSTLEDDPRFPQGAVAGLSGALALPASYAQEVLAVLEFYFCEPAGTEVTDPLLPSLTGIGYELGEFLAHRRGELKPSALTPRELEVLELAAQGCSGREIAERLVVSPATVRTHFEHIYEKYGVSDRASAVAKALREGLIE